MVMLLSGAVPASAERRRAVRVPEDAVAIEFVDAGSSDAPLTVAGRDAWLDLKSVSYMQSSREKVTRVRRRIGIRALGPEGSAGTASITARLDSADGRATYRIDGKPLKSVPLVVDAHAALGKLAFHTFEIEVPITASEGLLAASITWEVITE